MLWLERWRWHHAGRLYGERLGPYLAASYGGEPPYTVEQVNIAIAKLGLNPRHAALGYAAFISDAAYAGLKKVQPGLLDRQVAQVIYERYRPWSPAASDTFEDPRGFSGISRNRF